MAKRLLNLIPPATEGQLARVQRPAGYAKKPVRRSRAKVDMGAVLKLGFASDMLFRRSRKQALLSRRDLSL